MNQTVDDMFHMVDIVSVGTCINSQPSATCERLRTSFDLYLDFKL